MHFSRQLGQQPAAAQPAAATAAATPATAKKLKGARGSPQNNNLTSTVPVPCTSRRGGVVELGLACHDDRGRPAPPAYVGPPQRVVPRPSAMHSDAHESTVNPFPPLPPAQSGRVW